MLIVGLTGGIGSGKSTVANYFARLGVPIIDADQIARELFTTNTEVLTQLVEHFDATILTATGTLDRGKLRNIVFHFATERVWLEQLLHPLIFQEMQRQIAKLHAPYCILVIPLLFESTAHQLVDRSLVIDVPESVQIARTQQRDHCSIEIVKAIMQTQLKRKERLALADDIISNNQGLAELEQQVNKMHRFYTTHD